jgi:hypothetical protein
MFSIQTAGGIAKGDNRQLTLVYNATSATLARGATVSYLSDAAGASCDGFSVTVPMTNMLDLVAGIVADKTQTAGSTTGIASGDVGFIVTYGFTPYASLHTAASQVACAVGDKLVPVAGQTYLTYAAAGDGRDGHFVCLSSIASVSVSTNSNISCFVRAL